MRRYEMVKSHEEFNEIINKGKKISNKYMVVFFLPKDFEKPNFGIAVGKKIGNAVVRNKLKRQMRNIVDNFKFSYSNSKDYIIIIRKNCLDVEYKELEKHFINLIKNSNLIEEK